MLGNLQDGGTVKHFLLLALLGVVACVFLRRAGAPEWVIVVFCLWFGFKAAE